MIQPPPQDDNGKVIPHNHKEIKSEHELIRGINSEWIVTDANGKRISSSMAYKAMGSGMSVDIKFLIEQHGIDPIERVKNNPNWIGAVLFVTGTLRNMTYQVGYDPIPDTEANPNPYHGEVWGPFSKGEKRKLGKVASWLVEAPNVELV